MEGDSPPATTVMSISRKGTLDCKDVARALWKVGIASDVTSNVSFRYGSLESGCRITMDGNSKNKVRMAWGVLKDDFALDCAHVDVTSHFQGCIMDFLRPSTCPG